MFEELTYEELLVYDGGDARDVVTTIVGGCGAVGGAIAGFAVGHTVAGSVFTGPVAIGAGAVCAVGGAVAGYAAAKTAAESAWDAIANSLK